MASLRLVLLKMAIKLADVAHLLKDLKVTREWTVVSKNMIYYNENIHI